MSESESPEGRTTHARAVRRRKARPPEASNASETSKKPRLLYRVRTAIRVRHLSPLTEKAYIGWIKRFIFYFDKRHPDEMGENEISGYISHLATG